MAKDIEELAEKLGAEVVGTVPDYSAGAFGIAKLAHVLRAGPDRDGDAAATVVSAAASRLTLLLGRG